MIGRDGVGNVLHQDGLTGFWTCNKQSALALTDWGNDVDQSSRDVLIAAHVALKGERHIRK